MSEAQPDPTTSAPSTGTPLCGNCASWDHANRRATDERDLTLTRGLFIATCRKDGDMSPESYSCAEHSYRGHASPTEVLFFGQKVTITCDGICSKAWGIGGRPTDGAEVPEGGEPIYLKDDELGVAPDDPGSYEGNDAKPSLPVMKHNRWCARACERSKMEDGWNL